MRIDTTTCPDCGTVVAVNVLLSNRVLICPGLDCHHVHRFEDLPGEVQSHYEENPGRYRLG